MEPSKVEIKDSQRTQRMWVEIINQYVSHLSMLCLFWCAQWPRRDGKANVQIDPRGWEWHNECDSSLGGKMRLTLESRLSRQESELVLK